VASLLAVILTAACDPASIGDGALPVASRADSAGVEIVTVVVEAPGPEWARLDSAPDVRIGTLDGPEPTRFGTIQGVVPRAGGGVLVAEGQIQELRAFDASGTHLWTAGGIGDGPGEFDRIGTVGPFHGDSIMVHDSRADRLTFVGPDGGASRTVRLGWEGRPFRFTSARDGGLLGRMFHFPGPESMPGEGDDGVFRRDSASFRFAALDGAAGPELPGPVPDMEAIVQVRASDEMVAIEARPSPWSRYAYDAAAPGGAWLAVSDRFELHWYDDQGRLARIVRVSGLERSFADADVEATRDALFAEAAANAPDGVASPAARRQIEDLLEATPRPSTLPAFSGLRVGPDGRVWVLAWALADSPPERAWVFESDGTFLGRVDLPEGVRLEAVGTDAVWGVELDAFDVPSVVRYRLVPNGP
jgi:hypothetical protein